MIEDCGCRTQPGPVVFFRGESGLTERQKEVRDLAVGLMREHGLDGWTFCFNRNRRVMALCRWPLFKDCGGTIEVSGHYAENCPLEQLRDVILHEIAHALAGPEAGHGPRWKAMCRRVGANPARVTRCPVALPGV